MNYTLKLTCDGNMGVIKVLLDVSACRSSSGLVRPRSLVGTEEMLAAQDALDLGQVWDSGNMNPYAQRNLEFPLKYPVGKGFFFYPVKAD